MAEMIPLNLWWVGFLTYLAVHLFHLATWWGVPAMRNLAALFAVKFGLVFVLYGGLCLAGYPLESLIAPAILHLSITLSYIAIFPAFQASSPSVLICAQLASHRQGLRLEELEGEWEKDQLESRFRELAAANLITGSQASWKLTARGRYFILPFIVYRRMLGLDDGAG